jgi:hypothetical protein
MSITPYQRRSNRPCSTDNVMTPPQLAECIIKHFKPRGKCLEPCRGLFDAFFYYLPKDKHWDEIEQGRDFFERQGEKFNWIITNPPWSMMSMFLAHSFTLAHNVVMLIHVQQAFMPNRLRMAKFHKFGLKEIVLVDTPKRFPKSGFQLGAVHWRKHWKGPITITDKQTKPFNKHPKRKK